MQGSGLCGFAILVLAASWMGDAAAQGDDAWHASDDALCTGDHGGFDSGRGTWDYATVGGDYTGSGGWDYKGNPGDRWNHSGGRERIVAALRGLCEVPTISTKARGSFEATLDPEGKMIVFVLSYEGIETPVQQAHIHVGQQHTNGGISAFFCTNLGNGPPDTQPCPQMTATLTGTITREHIVGPGQQGITAGEFDELVRAIRLGAAYANVHSEAFPAGEIRGQVVVMIRDDDQQPRPWPQPPRGPGYPGGPR